MPFAKVSKITNNFNNTFKNLRGRKVPCQVPLHTESTNEDIFSPTKNGSPNSKFVSLERLRKSSYDKKQPKNINSRSLRTKQSEKRSVSPNSLDELFLSSSPVVQKPKNRKSKRKMTKSRPFSPSEYIRPSRSRSVCSLDKFCGSSTIPERTGTIRSCRKKNAELLWEGDVFSSESSSSNTNSKLKSKSRIKSEPLYDEWCEPSQEKTKQRHYRETSGAQRLDNVVHTELTRRPRSLCTLSCCNSLPSTGDRFKKQRIHKTKSFDNMSFTPSRMDEKYLKSSSGYLRQEDCILPTSKVVVEFRKKRTYRKKSISDTISMKPKRKPKISLLTFDDLKVPSSTVVVDIFKKRTYRKKISDFPTASSNNNWARSKATAPDLADDNAMFTPVKTISRNDDISGRVTNLEPSHNDNEINFSQSTVTASQTSDCVSQCQYIKRGRGRPRKIRLPVLEACPVVGSGLCTDDELTCTCSSTQSSVPRESHPGRRSRKKRWCWEDEQEEPQEEEVSEYELMRRRNIEENMKMLRQIFMDQGLELEEKSSDSPKMRKNYTRLPLPPPRPKSARIEVKRSSCSLDFSKFCHKHSV